MAGSAAVRPCGDGAGDALARDRSDHAQRQAARGENFIESVEPDAGFDRDALAVDREHARESIEIHQDAVGAGRLAPRVRAAPRR